MDADTEAIEAGVEVETHPPYITARVRADRLEGQFDALVAEATAAPVRCDLDDAVLLAEIAQHRLGQWVHVEEETEGLLCPSGTLPEKNETVLPRLIMAVLTLGGKPFAA